jgi:osomolarity two-component system sensor histidine kinase NIK1
MCEERLKEIINGMTESLSVFADEVTRVARVANVGGTWKDLTADG